MPVVYGIEDEAGQAHLEEATLMEELMYEEEVKFSLVEAIAHGLHATRVPSKW